MWADAQRDGHPTEYWWRRLRKFPNPIPFTTPQSLADARCWSAVQQCCQYTRTRDLDGTPAAGVSRTLRRRTRNGITELLQRAPPVFGRAAITFGIGPHSSSI